MDVSESVTAVMHYTIVFDNIIKMDIDRFYLFLFVALVPWIFFSTCLSYGTTAVLGQQDLVKKIYFPREVLPIAFTLSQFINMLLSFIVLFIVVLFSKITINPVALLYLPLVAAIEMDGGTYHGAYGTASDVYED